MSKAASKANNNQKTKPDRFNIGFTGAMFEFLNRHLASQGNDFMNLPPTIRRHFRCWKETRKSYGAREFLTIYEVKQPASKEKARSILDGLGISLKGYLERKPVRLEDPSAVRPRKIQEILDEFKLDPEPLGIRESELASIKGVKCS